MHMTKKTNENWQGCSEHKIWREGCIDCWCPSKTTEKNAMPGIFQRPAGAGLGVCHDPNDWWARIPTGDKYGAWVYVRDCVDCSDAYLSIELNGDLSETVTAHVNKALLCDLAWAILKKYEVPHIQEELQKLQYKAGW